MTTRFFIIAGVAAASLALAACDHHHKQPLETKGYAPVTSAPTLAVEPAADWK